VQAGIECLQGLGVSDGGCFRMRWIAGRSTTRDGGAAGGDLHGGVCRSGDRWDCVHARRVGFGGAAAAAGCGAGAGEPQGVCGIQRSHFVTYLAGARGGAGDVLWADGCGGFCAGTDGFDAASWGMRWRGCRGVVADERRWAAGAAGGRGGGSARGWVSVDLCGIAGHAVCRAAGECG
jgi:hypothetical protein